MLWTLALIDGGAAIVFIGDLNEMLIDFWNIEVKNESVGGVHKAQKNNCDPRYTYWSEVKTLILLIVSRLNIGNWRAN